MAWVVAVALGHDRSDAFWPGIALGIVNTAAPALLFNIGFDSLPAGIVMLLISLGPVFAAVAAHFAFDDEPFSAGKGVGLLLAIAGVAVLAFGSIDGGELGTIGLVLLGTVFAGGSAVLARQLAVRFGSRSLVAPQLTGASLAPLALMPIAGRSLTPVDGWEAWHLPMLVFVGAVCGYTGFWSIMRVNQLGTTGQASVVGYIIPVIGVVGGIVVFDDQLTTGVVLGGLLILTAVAIIGRASRPRHAVADRPATAGLR